MTEVARRRAGADTTDIIGGVGDREPRGRRARELLAFIRSEVERTGAFPNEAATMAAMRWKCTASLQDALLRLMALGFIERELVGRHYTRRRYQYHLCPSGVAQPEGANS